VKIAIKHDTVDLKAWTVRAVQEELLRGQDMDKHIDGYSVKRWLDAFCSWKK